jgi:tetratricopeptide (TPR) repeat protein
MASLTRINIVSKLPPEFNSNISVDNITYHVQTEDMAKASKVVTRIYLKGEVVFSKEAGYAHIVKLADFEAKRNALMERQHKTTISQFIEQQAEKLKLKPEFFKEVQMLLKRGKGKSAMEALRQALERFPSDPFLLSYYGCLLAVVEKRPKEGIEVCRDAIARLENSMPFGIEFFYPVFYLNLGRAYLKDGDRKQAVEIFTAGLKADPENHDLLWEMKKLGSRKRPAVPFLKRSNPINKYIGLMLSKTPK